MICLYNFDKYKSKTGGFQFKTPQILISLRNTTGHIPFNALAGNSNKSKSKKVVFTSDGVLTDRKYDKWF